MKSINWSAVKAFSRSYVQSTCELFFISPRQRYLCTQRKNDQASGDFSPLQRFLLSGNRWWSEMYKYRCKFKDLLHFCWKPSRAQVLKDLVPYQVVGAEWKSSTKNSFLFHCEKDFSEICALWRHWIELISKLEVKKT